MVTTRLILQTARLALRRVTLADGPFFLRLMNEPSWLENIGDRGVRSEAEAQAYIRSHVWSQYETHAFGMYAVQLERDSLPVGLCGLVKRDFLCAPDLGFALLPEYVGHGYAAEAAGGLMQHASREWGIARLYAIVKAENRRSVDLLGRLGFHRERPYLLPAGDEVELFATRPVADSEG